MFRRLRNRLLISNMTIISIVVIAAFAVVYFTTYTNIQKENQNKLESIPRLPSFVLGSTDSYDQQSGRVEHIVVIPRIPVEYSQSFIVLIHKDGEVRDIFSYIDMPTEVYHKIVEKVWQSKETSGTISFYNRKWQYRISSFGDRVLIREYNGRQEVIDSSDYYQLSFLDITDSSNTLTRLLFTFVFVGVAVLFILFVVSLYFANRSIRPVEDSWQKQKQFIADASHELKTPLAIITANIDALLANADQTVNSQQKWIGYIQFQVGRISKLLNDMLYLAKVEETVEETNKTQMPFELSGTVIDAITSMEAVIFEKGIQLTHKIEPDIFVKGDRERIKQTVLILLDNAIKYGNDHGHIHIELKRSRNKAIFSIVNTGEGIPQDKLPRVFDRFYRCDPSRSQATSGHGLGLSIAKAVIERSGGNIYAESSNGSTTFTFELNLS